MNLTGQVFGRLTALSVAENNKTGTYWICICECGNKKDIFIGHLRSGKILSCGCYKPNKTHGLTRTPEHITWCAMRNRCLSPSTNGYEQYGGRGIKICDEWADFGNFLSDMGRRPSKNHTLDRIDVNGDYKPTNCRWVTKSEQNENQRNSRRYVIGDKEYPSTVKAAKALGVTYASISKWCKQGFSPKLNKKCSFYYLYE